MPSFKSILDVPPAYKTCSQSPSSVYSKPQRRKESTTPIFHQPCPQAASHNSHPSSSTDNKTLSRQLAAWLRRQPALVLPRPDASCLRPAAPVLIHRAVLLPDRCVVVPARL